MALLTLAAVRSFLAESEASLRASLEAADTAGRLHTSAHGKWSAAQTARHLIRTEAAMLPIWLVVPKLRRVPVLLSALDRANGALWRACGMRTIEAARSRLTRANATDGRFVAPVFLRPPSRAVPLASIWEHRRRVRERSWRAIHTVDDAVLATLTWSHPLIGAYTLLEFVEFLGTHEQHHLPHINGNTGDRSGVA